MDEPEKNPNVEMMHPYCGGCGHNFFREPKVPRTQAEAEAGTRRCHYCYEDAEADRKDSRHC